MVRLQLRQQLCDRTFLKNLNTVAEVRVHASMHRLYSQSCKVCAQEPCMHAKP